MMLTWPWWIYSIIAAVIWGLHFNLVVKISRVLPADIYSPLTLFFITSISIFMLLPFCYQAILANLLTIYHSPTGIRISALLLIITALLAASLLYIAMQMSGNATVAALIDITYPMFIALIAWLLYRENHLDWSVIVGGVLILSGSMLIIWKHG